MSETTPSTAVEPVIDPKILDKVRTGSIAYTDLVKAVAPPPIKPPVASLIPPAIITPAQRDALKKLPDVFGSVVPEERRRLEVSEITKILEERGVLKIVEKLIESRVEDIRLTALNHSDVYVENTMKPDEIEELPRDKDGHYALKHKVMGDGDADECISFEPSAGTSSCTAAALKALSEDPEYGDFTHADYLAMTEQVRVFDDHKAMLLLKKRPELVKVIRDATTTGSPSITVTPRKAK